MTVASTPTPLEAMVLRKLSGKWSYDRGSNHPQLKVDAMPVVKTLGMNDDDSLDLVEMTDAEKAALKGWFEKHGLKSASDAADIQEGEFSIINMTKNNSITFDLTHDDFDPIRDEQEEPARTGPIQGYYIKLHTEDFARLERQYSANGWFDVTGNVNLGRSA